MGMFLEESGHEFRPRILRVDLGAPKGSAGGVSARTEVWDPPDGDLMALGRLSGSALSLCLYLSALRAQERPPGLVLSVGAAVREGLPTASRATIAGLSPLTGGYVDSQIGGGLGRRLARLTDALVLEGRAPGGAGAVLVLGADGGARVELEPGLACLGVPQRAARLKSRYPEGSGLCIGRAGERGVAFSSLATLGDPPSYSGRGGLGARLGELGLGAIVVDCPLPESPREPEWAARLDRSAHLRARGTGGTFELLDAFAARGDLPADPNLRAGFASTLRAREACPGCPTACRHVVGLGERKLLGRFSATHPLGQRLGLHASEDQLRLLEVCNDLGVDAGETGALLELLQRRASEGEGAPGKGDLAQLIEEVQALLADNEEGRLRACGVQAYARALGFPLDLPTSRGSAVRVVSDGASLLGQCVSVRGNDPMRVFPFLSENGGDRGRLASLFGRLDLPARTFDPKSPVGKGRLVWWHENLANVVDATGFCAFSAAGLLGDGLGDLDDLANWLPLPGLAKDGEALQAAGASLVLLQRELARRLGEEPGADLPDWAEEELRRPGMWDEYRILRGLADNGELSPHAQETVGTLGVLTLGQLPESEPERVPARVPEERGMGEVSLNASGALARALDGGGSYQTLLPQTLGGLLRELALERPGSAEWLWGDQGSVVSVYRETRRLQADELVRAGDRLDFVLAISGG